MGKVNKNYEIVLIKDLKNSDKLECIFAILNVFEEKYNHVYGFENEYYVHHQKETVLLYKIRYENKKIILSVSDSVNVYELIGVLNDIIVKCKKLKVSCSVIGYTETTT